MSHIELHSVKFSQKDWNCHFNGILNHNKWTVVCGPSGSGKSTLLHLLTGLLAPIDGDIKMGGNSITALPPHKRGIGFMSQANMLFPAITIQENLLLTLHNEQTSKLNKIEKIKELVESLRLETQLLKRFPGELSGGQLSRANLARSILISKKWLLLDEPFSAVDRTTRLEILLWLKNYQKSKSIGILLVSHDLDDVFTVATDVAIVGNGSLLEVNDLEVLTTSPSNELTARTLRTGLVLNLNSQTMFVSSDHLKTSRNQMQCDSSYIHEAILSTPHAKQYGDILRVIDLSGSCDVTIATNTPFDGRLYFDARSAKILQKSTTTSM